MIDARQQGAEVAAIAADPTDRNAAVTHAMIGLRPSDEAGSAAFAAETVIGARDLQGGIDRLGAGVREEYVIDRAGRHGRQAVGQLERGRVGHLE